MIIRKTFKAEIAHRLLNVYSKRCEGLHGHSYIFEIFLEGEMKTDGMVMDFSEVKDRINDFMDKFDHSLLCYDRDVFLVDNAPNLNSRYIIVPFNTTAENMAAWIYSYIASKGLPIHKVKVHETATGYAECNKDLFSAKLDSIKYSI